MNCLELGSSRVQDPHAAHNGTKTIRETVTESAPRLSRSHRSLVRRSSSPRPSSDPPRLVCFRGVLPIRISRRALLDTRPWPNIHPGKPQGKGSLKGLFRPNVSFSVSRASVCFAEHAQTREPGSRLRLYIHPLVDSIYSIPLLQHGREPF